MGLFGDITRKLFGGSKSTNESGNLYAEDLYDAYMPSVLQGTAGMGRMNSVLGGGPEGAQALKDWWGSSGGQFQLTQGLGDVNDKFHSLGLGRSGATMKAMEGFRSDLASTKLGEYMGYNRDLAQLGLGAGGLVASAGEYSKGKSTKDGGGLGKALGMLFASDPRLKTNVVKIGAHPDGLGIYSFDYLPHDGPIAAFMPEGRQLGVMADEVAALRPWALGPTIGGFATVRYDRLEAA